MADNVKDEIVIDEVRKDPGKYNLEVYFEYNNNKNRMTWIEATDRLENFYFGKQFDGKDIKILNERGQMAIPINRTRPLIRNFVSMCTAKDPSFTVIGVKKSDHKKSWMFRGVIDKILRDNYISREGTRAIFDFARRGLGNLIVDFDPHARYGKGEVTISYATNREVIWDPNATSWAYRDSENVIYTKVILVEKAIEIFAPEDTDDDDKTKKKKAIIRNEILKRGGIAVEDFQVRTETSESTEGSEISLSRDLNEQKSIGSEYVRVIQRHTKEKVPVWVVTEKGGKQREYYSEKRANKYTEELKSKKIENITTKLNLIRVVRHNSVVDYFIDKEVLPLTEYPMIPLINEDTQNPFPEGDIRYLEPMQNILNKAIGITIFNAQVSSNPRTYIDPRSVNKDDLQKMKNLIAQPGSMSFVKDPGKNVKESAGMPLNPAWFQIIQNMQEQMQYQISIYPSDMGDPSGAHRTFRGTLAVHEWGQKNVALALKSINDSYTLMGKVVLEYIQAEYRAPDVIRMGVDYLDDIEEAQELEQEEGIEREGNELIININQAIKDSEGIVKYFNDLSVGEYDIAIVPNSFLYTDRVALGQQMMEFKERNIVDAEAVLDVADIKDKDKIKKRISLVEGLRQTTEQLSQSLNNEKKRSKSLEYELARTDRALTKKEFENKLNKILIKFEKLEVNLKGEITRMRDESQKAKEKISDKEKSKTTK